MLTLWHGRAATKASVAKAAQHDASPSLPLERCSLALWKRSKPVRRHVLATAANTRAAYAIANHLGRFNERVASRAEHALQGSAKAAA